MKRVARLVEWLTNKLIVMIYITIVLVGFLQVTTRYLFNVPFIWVDELSKYLFVWLVFLGIAIAAKKKAHFATDFLIRMFPKPLERFILKVAHVCSLAFLAICIWLVPQVMMVAHKSLSSTVGIPLSFVYGGMLVGFVLTFIAELKNFYDSFLDDSQTNIDTDIHNAE